MTATQVLFLFLKEECTIDEMRFFKNCIMKDPDNKYFRKRPLFKPTFVEDYLSRNNRCLNNFMTRLFILAPSIKNYRFRNPRWFAIRESYNKRNSGKYITKKVRGDYETEDRYMIPCVFREFRSGMYINYYRRKWNEFLNKRIESDKKFNSPFKKGESYDFRLKTQ